MPVPGSFLGHDNMYPTACQQCGRPNAWYCVDCGVVQCDEHWDQSPPHLHVALGQDGMPHEKLEPQIRSLFGNALALPQTAESLDRLHDDDVETTWFGIGKDQNNIPFLADGVIFNALMAECREGNEVKYPQLVSFIGQTNSGKSTLIKLLVTLAEWRTNRRSDDPFATPIIGAQRDETVPTTADVHLYADPTTFRQPTPLMYADCEGLNAGEAITRAEVRRRPRRHGIHGGKLRRLEWAHPNKPETLTRAYAVAELYPRILYTFSDVVVFVLRNVKTFQSESLPKLLEWGRASLKTSVNNPVKPHVIVAINAAEINVGEEEWTVQYATRRLLDSASTSLTTPYVSSLVQHWERRKVRIRSILDLIRCYYRSFVAVRIPRQTRYGRLKQQVDILREEINHSCAISHQEKRRTRMLSNSDEANMYVQSAFDHFTRDLRTPFNFVQESLRLNPIPRDFGDHILQLVLNMRRKYDSNYSTRWLFDKMSSIVASSIILDFTRYQRKGLPQSHLNKYQTYLEYVLREFCDVYTPCTFINKKGKCINTAVRHGNRHQDARGKVLSTGEYESNLDVNTYNEDWLQSVKQHIVAGQAELQQMAEVESVQNYGIEEAIKWHGNQIKTFFDTFDGLNTFRSNTTCFCCLMESPLHPLPCGHALCTTCVKDYGILVYNHDYLLEGCPIHVDHSAEYWPYLIRFKPDLAGVRILSLDGGGVRGIIQLEMLAALQEALGDGIPIQNYFDLIVGTNTAGMIAIALGQNGWDIQRCIREFTVLTKQAHSDREFSGIPFLHELVVFHHGSKYKTTPLHKALRDSLGYDTLYGPTRRAQVFPSPKVAVTATNEAGKRAIVIANYHRLETIGAAEQTTYDFPRANNPTTELKLWEAAAATMATPDLFKPFHHQPTQKSFVDGIFQKSNPVEFAQNEYRLIWPDVVNQPPDLLLSLGTGQILPQVPRKRSGKLDFEDGLEAVERSPPYSHSAARRASRSEGKLTNPQTGRREAVCDEEREWEKIINSISRDIVNERNCRYVRVNPNVASPLPEIDDVSSVLELQREIADVLNTSRLETLIHHIAKKLIASAFYLHMTEEMAVEQSGRCYAYGKILCKFKGEMARQLMIHIKKRRTSSFRPYFELSEYNRGPSSKFYIHSGIHDRIERGEEFEVGPFKITPSSPKAIMNITLYVADPLRISSAATAEFSISGFPRSLSKNGSTPISSPTSPQGPQRPGAQHARSVSDGYQSRGSQPELEGNQRRNSSYPGVVNRVPELSALGSLPPPFISHQEQIPRAPLLVPHEVSYASSNVWSTRPEEALRSPLIIPSSAVSELPTDGAAPYELPSQPTFTSNINGQASAAPRSNAQRLAEVAELEVNSNSRDAQYSVSTQSGYSRSRRRDHGSGQASSSRRRRDYENPEAGPSRQQTGQYTDSQLSPDRRHHDTSPIPQSPHTLRSSRRRRSIMNL